MVIYRCGYIVMYSTIIIGQFRYIIIIIYEVPTLTNRETQRQFSENICSGDDLRFRIFETFVVKFLAFLPLVGFSNI